jgi:hypothetical protein
MFGLKSRQLFFILFTVAVVYVAVQFIAVYYRAFQFQDFVYQEVRFASSKRKPTEKVRASIVDEAKNWDIPIKPRDIHITKRGPSFSVEIDYSLIVDLRVHQYTWPQRVVTAGPLFEDDRN